MTTAADAGGGPPPGLARLWAGWRTSYLDRLTAGDDSLKPDDTGRSLFERIWHSGLPDEDTFILWRGERIFAILNAYPYGSGHLMVLPQVAAPDLGDPAYPQSVGPVLLRGDAVEVGAVRIDDKQVGGPGDIVHGDARVAGRGEHDPAVGQPRGVGIVIAGQSILGQGVKLAKVEILIAARYARQSGDLCEIGAIDVHGIDAPGVVSLGDLVAVPQFVGPVRQAGEGDAGGIPVQFGCADVDQVKAFRLGVGTVDEGVDGAIGIEDAEKGRGGHLVFAVASYTRQGIGVGHVYAAATGDLAGDEQDRVFQGRQGGEGGGQNQAENGQETKGMYRSQAGRGGGQHPVRVFALQDAHFRGDGQRLAKHSRLSLSNISNVSDSDTLCKQLSKPIGLSACYLLAF